MIESIKKWRKQVSYAKQFEIIYVDLYSKKVFFNEQSKEIQANNIMGKTRDIFKKTGDTKGTVHRRMGTCGLHLKFFERTSEVKQSTELKCQWE